MWKRGLSPFPHERAAQSTQNSLAVLSPFPHFSVHDLLGSVLGVHFFDDALQDAVL